MSEGGVHASPGRTVSERGLVQRQSRANQSPTVQRASGYQHLLNSSPKVEALQRRAASTGAAHPIQRLAASTSGQGGLPVQRMHNGSDDEEVLEELLEEVEEEEEEEEEEWDPTARALAVPLTGAQEDQQQRAVEALKGMDGWSVTPMDQHLATDPRVWPLIKSGEWSAPMRGWFERGEGDERRRIILLGETHNRMEHLAEHLFNDKATRFWEKNLHVGQVVKGREDYADWRERFSDGQRKYFDKTLGALQKGAVDGHVLDMDSDEATLNATTQLGMSVGDDVGELIGRLVASDTEIYDQLSGWMDSAEPKDPDRLALGRRRWRYASVLVGAQHYRGLADYITRLGGFEAKEPGPSLVSLLRLTS
ncbi:hypothetical protein ACN469_17210 [Corallococcus terminator]